ncbi:MAG: formimidoylglutamate deiminase [Acidimicrobiia bacterium]|nr:formimidoylglutamate deiminase [Acidimicrobiia bacterium]
MKYWCEYAWLGGASVARSVELEVVDSRFVSLRTDVASESSGSTVLPGVTLPGLANAHSHAFHRALRGRARGDTFWDWRDGMYALAERLDPDSYGTLATAVFGEMALAGITAVGEFHYLHHGPRGVPYDDPNEMTRAVAVAATTAGIRLTVLDTCYLAGGIGEPLSPVQQRFSDGTAEGWVERVDLIASSPSVKLGAAVHSVRAVDPDSIATVAKWADHQIAPLHAHVSEQPAENAACIDRYGKTPTEVLGQAGALSERFTAVHATHLSERDIELLGGAAATLCMCPTTERDLADGVGEAHRLVTAGAKLSLGSDSHAVIDLFEEARAVELDERLVTGTRGGHSAEALMNAATSGGQRALGWHEAGRIAVGQLADFVTVGLDSVRLAGSTQDSLLSSIVMSANAADVRTVVVGGDLIVDAGAHKSLDVERELAMSIAAVWD